MAYYENMQVLLLARLSYCLPFATSMQASQTLPRDMKLT